MFVTSELLQSLSFAGCIFSDGKFDDLALSIMTGASLVQLDFSFCTLKVRGVNI
jgi:hypothetical protein